MGSSRSKGERGEGSVNMMTARWLRGWALSDEWAVGKATYLQDKIVLLRQEDRKRVIGEWIRMEGKGVGEQMQRSGGKEREEELTLSFALGSAPLASSSDEVSFLPL